jgi:hypothetical protein
MRIPKGPLVAAFVAATFLSPLAGHAQAPAPASPSATAPAPGHAAIPDQQITKAANAIRQVMSLRQIYSQRIAKAKPEDRGRIAAEGESEMRQAVADQGLSVEQYNAILQTAQNDPTLRAKLLSRVPAAGAAPTTPAGH